MQAHTVLVVLVAALGLTGPSLFAQENTDKNASAAVQKIGLPHDWSHHHLVFSAPTSIEQSVKLSQEPRYWQQQTPGATAPPWGGRASAIEAPSRYLADPARTPRTR